MARKGVDDLTRQKIRNAYLEIPLDEMSNAKAHAKLAKRFGVSVPTIKRIVTGLSREVRDAISEAVESNTRHEATDYEQALNDAFTKMAAQAKTVPVKDGSSAARAMLEILKEIERRNPETVEQLVEYVLNHPAFSVQSFMKALRDRIEQTA